MKSTVIGIVVGFLLLGIAILWSIGFQFGRFVWFFDPKALLIVLGGIMCTTFIAYPHNKISGAFGSYVKALTRNEISLEDYIQEIETLSMGEIEEDSQVNPDGADEIGEAFLSDGLRMVVNKHPADEVRRVMTERIKNTLHNDMAEAKVIRNMAKIAPAFGVLGTLLGLVMMMRSLDSDDAELMTSLGTGMGTALLSIFYGVLLSNFLFTPVAIKIETRAAQRVVLMNIIMEGITLLIHETPTEIVRDKLQAFLALK